MREIQAERLRAEHELGEATNTQDGLTLEQARALIAGVKDAVEVLRTADPALKGQLYRALGISILYHPHRADAEVDARVVQSVSEGGLVP